MHKVCEQCLAESKLYKNVCWLNKFVLLVLPGLMEWRIGVKEELLGRQDRYRWVGMVS